MEYQVPQFIEVEDKIVGPLTLRQFIYLAGGGGLCAAFLVYLPLIFGILLSIPFGGLAVALAFYKVNGKPFSSILEAAVSYYTGAKLFLWRREEKKEATKKLEVPEPRTAPHVRLTSGKLQQLAWSLD